MPSPKDVLSRAKVVKLAQPVEETTQSVDNSAISELISRAFATRNALHFAHWGTNSFAAHEALGYLYNGIISQIDEIVEVYQGKFGLLSGLKSDAVSVPKDICRHVKAEAEWLCENRGSIANGVDAIANLLDELDAAYLKTIYKLENLK